MARKEPRQPVNRPAAIVLGKNRLPCRIADISRTGAMLLVSNAALRLPKSFEVEDAFTGIRRPATVAWTDGKRIGVRFKRATELAPQRQTPVFGRRKA